MADDRAIVDEQIAEIMEAARAAWPGVEISAELFSTYLIERVPADTDIAVALRTLHTTDLYLACACAHGDPQAIAAFDRHCMAAVDRALGRLGVGADAIAEVKQGLRHTLLVADSSPPKIVGFSGRGDMRRWVRVMAVRSALALTRANRRASAGDEALEDAVATGDDPEVQYLKRRYRDEFATAFGQAVERLSHRDRLLLRQHFLDGVTVGRLAELHRVHRATASRWLDDARTTVLTATREILMARLDVAPAELDSIMRLIGSQLAVNPRALYPRRRS